MDQSHCQVPLVKLLKSILINVEHSDWRRICKKIHRRQLEASKLGLFVERRRGESILLVTFFSQIQITWIKGELYHDQIPTLAS
jgi:hypothetical protein